VHGLEQAYGDKITFVYLDIDDPRNDEFKRQLGYLYQPNLFLLDGSGAIVQEWLGPVTGEELAAAFDGQLSQ
jgi:hypothetical protein